MKKNHMTLSIAAAAVMALSMTGCTKTGQSSSSTSSSFTKTDPETISFSWQNTYETTLNEFKKSDQFSNDSAFDIVDIIGDSTPELLISPNTEIGTGCIIYSLNGSDAYEVDTVGNKGTLIYSPSTGTVRDEYIGNGFVIGKVLKYSGNEFNEILTYSDNTASASMGAAITHEINGEEVMLSEYDKALAPYSGNRAITVGRRFSFGSDTIRYALKCSESWNAVLAPYQKDLCKTKLTELMDSFTVSDTSADPAFDFCDMNGDKIPEIIVSDGSAENNTCKIYYFSEDSMNLMDGEYGKNGVFCFDTQAYVFFAKEDSGTTYWSVANAAFSASDYKESDSIAIIGRKYLLNSDSINAVFN